MSVDKLVVFLDEVDDLLFAFVSILRKGFDIHELFDALDDYKESVWLPVEVEGI